MARGVRLSAQTATAPDLGQFRKVNAGERITLYMQGSAADGVSAVAQLGPINLFTGVLPLEVAAGRQGALTDLPIFDVQAPISGELAITVTPGANTYDLQYYVTP